MPPPTRTQHRSRLETGLPEAVLFPARDPDARSESEQDEADRRTGEHEVLTMQRRHALCRSHPCRLAGISLVLSRNLDYHKPVPSLASVGPPSRSVVTAVRH